MRLNLGAADRHIEGFLCIDIAPPPCAVCDGMLSAEGVYFPIIRRSQDLSQPWLWADSSIEEIMALDVFEHLPSRIATMNEAHRVLVPGGRLTIETPDASRGVGYFQDPTHCSPWCMSTFKYFEAGAFAHTRLAKAYGITAAFRVLLLQELGPMSGEDSREQVWKIRAVMEAVK